MVLADLSGDRQHRDTALFLAIVAGRHVSVRAALADPDPSVQCRALEAWIRSGLTDADELAEYLVDAPPLAPGRVPVAAPTSCAGYRGRVDRPRPCGDLPHDRRIPAAPGQFGCGREDPLLRCGRNCRQTARFICGRCEHAKA